jgi:hypothetical protein
MLSKRLFKMDQKGVGYVWKTFQYEDTTCAQQKTELPVVDRTDHAEYCLLSPARVIFQDLF